MVDLLGWLFILVCVVWLWRYTQGGKNKSKYINKKHKEDFELWARELDNDDVE